MAYDSKGTWPKNIGTARLIDWYNITVQAINDGVLKYKIEVDWALQKAHWELRLRKVGTEVLNFTNNECEDKG